MQKTFSALGIGALLLSWSIADAKKPRKEQDAAPAASVGSARPDQATWHMPPPIQLDQLTVKDGLPQSQVYAIAQDQLGFLWFGTQGGLARYDGYSFRTYRHDAEDASSISGSYVTALAVDPNGHLWIGTGEAGLNRFDPSADTFVRYQHDEKNGKSISSNGVLAILPDQDVIWVGTNGGGLNRLDPKTGTFETFTLEELDIPAEPVVGALARDADGHLWLGLGGTLVQLDPKSKEAQQWAISDSPVGALLLDRDGKIWVGTKGDGLFLFDPKTNQRTRYASIADDPTSLSDDRVNSLLFDARGSLWVGTDRGLNERVKGQTAFARYVNTPGVASTSSFPTGVLTGLQDRGGVLWFGTVTGVRKIPELARNFGHYFIDEFVTCVLVGEQGTVWAGTYEGGLYKYDRQRRRVTHYRALRRDDGERVRLTSWVTTLHEAKDGTIWLSAVGLGLLAFDPVAEVVRQFELRPGDQAQRIDRIVPSGSSFWLATWGQGLTHFDPSSGRFESYPNDEFEPNSPASNHLYLIARDTKDPNVLWLGTGDSGLDRYDLRTKTAKHYPHDPNEPDGPSHASITAIHQDGEGVLWLGTYGGGLNRFDPASDKWERWSTKQGLTNDQIYGIEQDEQGKLWLSTNGGGLSVFDPKAKTFSHYDARDGVQSDEFIQNGHHKSAKGELAFAGTKGFNVFRPAEIHHETAPPQIALTGFRIFSQEAELGKPIWTLPQLDLSYTDSVFSFEFAALDFTDPNKNRYAYKLEGLHDEWIESSNRFVTYSNLDGGDYVFQVRAASRYGQWNETALSIPLSMAPPPWKTWWAYLLYVMTLGGVAFAYVRYQQQRVQALEQANRLMTVEKDLELTGVIQTGFLPEESSVKGAAFRLLGYYRPADFASGDWWWHERHGDIHAVLVGDVTGHGAGPAMVTAAVATAFRVQTDEESFENKLEMVNAQVLSVGKGKYHMTLSAVVLDERTGKFVFYSAGGLPLICISREGKARVVACRGTPLGAASFKFGRVDGQLSPGERVVVCTDGIPELQMPNGRMLGMRGFTRICERVREVPLEQAVEEIVREADKARQNMPQEDDWTFALLEWGAA